MNNCFHLFPNIPPPPPQPLMFLGSCGSLLGKLLVYIEKRLSDSFLRKLPPSKKGAKFDLSDLLK